MKFILSYFFQSEIGAEEAEEVGVEHLLRDIKDTTVGTLSQKVTNQVKYVLVNECCLFRQAFLGAVHTKYRLICAFFMFLYERCKKVSKRRKNK